MAIVSSAMLVMSGVYLALGLIYLRFWWAERSRLDYLAFTLCALSVTLFSWFELGMMHSQTPEAYLFFAWWNFLVGVLVTLAIAWYAYLNLRGRRWLFWTYCAFRLLGVVVHLILPNGINFREITSVGRMTVLGEALSYPIVVPNPWMVLPHLSHILLVIFCLDASIRTWRRGELRKALVFGTGVVLSRTIVSIVSIGVLWGMVQLPFIASVTILFVIAAMLYELNYDMHRAAMLTDKLEERETRLTETLDQLQLSAAAAHVGLWTRKVGEEKIWLSEKAADVWGFPSGKQVKREDLFQHIHPADREPYITNIRELEEWKNEYHMEYRILSKEGNIRWIHSRGRAETVDGSRILRGAIVDITNLKLAQEAVHDLSRKLLNAQEEERARLARELHDDLSQSIALLSIQLTQLRNEPKDLEHVRGQLDQYISDIERLSGDVRRISHELHPAKLTQLGLEAALRGFCRELAVAHPMQIDLEAENLPRNLPVDISLCLYRVTQESLQNVIKHSAASSARVTIKLEHNNINLSVSDNGKGFDPEATKGKEALGLISIDERVRAVKGTFKVSSQAGAGTRIEVLVPVGSESAADIDHDQGINTRNTGRRVIVADDNRAMLETIVGLLTPHFEVVGTAADGAAALEIIDRLKPDIAVLDISMPFQTGIEIAADLKSRAPEVKVVIVSANADESYIRAAYGAGALAYVVKTRLLDELVPAIEQAFAGNGFISTGDKAHGFGDESDR